MRLKEFAALAALGLLLSCGGGESSNIGNGREIQNDSFANDIERAKAEYLTRSIDVTATVVDSTGNPIPRATVSANERSAVTADDGSFRLTLPRQTTLLQITANGFHPYFSGVVLQTPSSDSTHALQPIVLEPTAADTLRLIFGGDVSFGRRFMDPDDTTTRDKLPSDHPGAIISVADPEPGARSVMQYLRPLLQSGDFTALNFESPVLNTPATPHPTKDFVFFSLTGTLPALSWAGVDYVSLGNNHVYDYLESGLAETLRAFQAVGLPASGAGATPTDAFSPYRVTVRGQNLAFVSATSIDGREHAFSYVADTTKGGAADLTDSMRLRDTISDAARNARVIAQLHGGFEYSFAPSSGMRTHMENAAAAGASLIVMHHTHTAQGFARAGSVPAALGLGNFALDQDRLETMLGLVLIADMRAGQATNLRGVPIYLKDYRPRLIGGELADYLIRRIAEHSDTDVQVYPYQQQAWVNYGQERPAQRREVRSDVQIGVDGTGYLDLRPLRALGESLSRVHFSAGVRQAQLGRDVMIYGDFEDWDADASTLDAPRWDLTGDSTSACLQAAHRGSSGACSLRHGQHSTDSVLPFRHTVRIQYGDAPANKDVTVLTYLKGSNAGAATLRANYVSDADELDFGSEDIATRAVGTYDWQLIAAPLHFPADSVTRRPPPDITGRERDAVPARGVRLLLRHAPPVDGAGLLMADDFAVVSWEENTQSGETLRTPHARDFLRLQGAPGTYSVTLEFTHYRPL